MPCASILRRCSNEPAVYLLVWHRALFDLGVRPGVVSGLQVRLLTCLSFYLEDPAFAFFGALSAQRACRRGSFRSRRRLPMDLLHGLNPGTRYGRVRADLVRSRARPVIGPRYRYRGCGQSTRCAVSNSFLAIRPLTLCAWRCSRLDAVVAAVMPARSVGNRFEVANRRALRTVRFLGNRRGTWCCPPSYNPCRL